MEVRKETFREGIQITDLKPGDIIYIQRIISGFMYNLECEFLEVKRGIVKGRVISSDVSYGGGRTTPVFPIGMEKGKIIRARLKKCFLWGKSKDNEYARCHWFK